MEGKKVDWLQKQSKLSCHSEEREQRMKASSYPFNASAGFSPTESSLLNNPQAGLLRCNTPRNDDETIASCRVGKASAFPQKKHSPPSPWERGRAAFTLAEVLITLGIIGVVAAMTLPTILNKTRNKELHTAFLKTYTELNQIAQMIVANEGISISDSISNNTGCGAMPPETANKIFKYFKGDSSFLTRNGQGTNDGNGNFIPYYKIKTLNGNAYSGGANSAGSDSSFLCDNSGFKSNASGALYILSDPPANGQNGPVICVDINGKKGPNRYGIDYFMFIFTVDGKVIPVGQKHKNNPQVCNSSNGSCCNFNNVGAQYCSNTSNDISKNTSCAYYALTNTHPTKNGKDYWTDFLGEVYSR